MASNRLEFLGPTPRWCLGCGYFGCFKALTSVIANSGVPREKFVVVSGIGCSARLPYYTKMFGFHTLHGRAAPVAQGIKQVRPDLCVWMVTGDGDCLSIGTNHIVHLLRRNPEIKVMLLNNQVYGLTKGQASPTSPKGQVAKMSPRGTVDSPINPVRLALASGATFVARAHDNDGPYLEEILTAAQNHKGTAFVEVLTNCVSFNDGAINSLTERALQAETNLKLRRGQKMLFGAEGKRGMALVNGALVEVDGADPAVAAHDPSHPAMGQLLAAVEFSQRPYPFGIFADYTPTTNSGEIL